MVVAFLKSLSLIVSPDMAGAGDHFTVYSSPVLVTPKASFNDLLFLDGGGGGGDDNADDEEEAKTKCVRRRKNDSFSRTFTALEMC